MRVGGKWPHAIPRNDRTSGVSSLAVLWRRDAVTERLVRGGSQGRRELLKPPPGRAPLCLLPHGPVYAGGGSGALFPLLKLLAENEPLWSVGKAKWYILERATLFQGPRKLEAGDSSTHHLSGRLHVARRCNHAGDARPLDILPLLSACRPAGAPPSPASVPRSPPCPPLLLPLLLRSFPPSCHTSFPFFISSSSSTVFLLGVITLPLLEFYSVPSGAPSTLPAKSR